jgi:hypothetical protein
MLRWQAAARRRLSAHHTNKILKPISSQGVKPEDIMINYTPFDTPTGRRSR